MIAEAFQHVVMMSRLRIFAILLCNLIHVKFVTSLARLVKCFRSHKFIDYLGFTTISECLYYNSHNDVWNEICQEFPYLIDSYFCFSFSLSAMGRRLSKNFFRFIRTNFAPIWHIYCDMTYRNNMWHIAAICHIVLQYVTYCNNM